MVSYTNFAALKNTSAPLPERSFLDSIELAISKHDSFSAHGKLADISFPSWPAVVLALAVPAIVALLLIYISRPRDPGTTTRKVLLWVAWFNLGGLLGAMLFGAYDLGVGSGLLAIVLASIAVRLCRSKPKSYVRLARGLTLIYLVLAPGALPALLSGTFVALDFRALLHQPPSQQEVLQLCGMLDKPYPELCRMAREGQVSVRLANGSVGPLAELYNPVIGPPTIRLDKRLVTSEPERAAACLAHELMHVSQHRRPLPGITGTFILDLESRDLLEYEKGVADIELNPGPPVVATNMKQVSAQEDYEGFYPEYKHGPREMLLRRFGAALLLIVAYLLWPRLRALVPCRERVPIGPTLQPELKRGQRKRVGAAQSHLARTGPGPNTRMRGNDSFWWARHNCAAPPFQLFARYNHESPSQISSQRDRP